MLRSTCPNHLILLVRSIISRFWIPSIERLESELTSPFALTLQIQRIIARSLRLMRLRVASVMAQVSAACSITLLTQVEYTRPLVTRGGLRLVRRGGGAVGGTCPKHIYNALQRSARNHHQQRSCPPISKTLGQPQAFRHQPSRHSLFFHQ